MTFDEILAQALELLRREGRVSYRALKRRFALDDEYLEDLKAEIIKAKKLAFDEDGEVLVWSGASPVSDSRFQVQRNEEISTGGEKRCVILKGSRPSLS